MSETSPTFALMPHKVYTDDPRVHTIAPLVEQKKITTLGQIFRWVPRVAVADMAGIGRKTLTRLLLEPGSITLDQANTLADLFNLDREVMMGLIRAHAREVKKGGHELPRLDYGVGK